MSKSFAFLTACLAFAVAALGVLRTIQEGISAIRMMILALDAGCVYYAVKTIKKIL